MDNRRAAPRHRGRSGFRAHAIRVCDCGEPRHVLGHSCPRSRRHIRRPRRSARRHPRRIGAGGRAPLRSRRQAVRRVRRWRAGAAGGRRRVAERQDSAPECVGTTPDDQAGASPITAGCRRPPASTGSPGPARCGSRMARKVVSHVAEATSDGKRTRGVARTPWRLPVASAPSALTFGRAPSSPRWPATCSSRPAQSTVTACPFRSAGSWRVASRPLLQDVAGPLVAVAAGPTAPSTATRIQCGGSCLLASGARRSSCSRRYARSSRRTSRRLVRGL